jgi:hypothetical protein
MHRVVAAVLLMAGMGLGRGGSAEAQDKRPVPLTEGVLATWEKAGAQAGWMGQDKFGFVKFRTGGEGSVGDAAELQKALPKCLIFR